MGRLATLAIGSVLALAIHADAYTRPGGQVNVGTVTPVIVCPAEPGRYACNVANLDDADTLFCGESASITTTTAGDVVFPRSGRTFDRDISGTTPPSTATRALYCISDGDGARAAFSGVVR